MSAKYQAPRVLGLATSPVMRGGAPASEIGRLTAPVRWARPSVPKPHRHRGRRALPDLVAARRAMGL